MTCKARRRRGRRQPPSSLIPISLSLHSFQQPSTSSPSITVAHLILLRSRNVKRIEWPSRASASSKFDSRCRHGVPRFLKHNGVSTARQLKDPHEFQSFHDYTEYGDQSRCRGFGDPGCSAGEKGVILISSRRPKPPRKTSLNTMNRVCPGTRCRPR